MAYTSEWDSTPWAIDGAPNGVKAARAATWASTGGAEGIIGVNDLKVRQLDTPGAGVQVAPGGALVLNRAPGGTNETYVPRLGVRDLPEIAKTGTSGGRNDLIYVSVEDPYEATEYQPPADPETAQFVFTRVLSNVPASTKKLTDVLPNATGYAVALVKIPANTATITDAMITDLRQVARPRRDQQVFAHAQTAADTTQPLNSTNVAGEYWPDQSGLFYAEVPTWATRVQIIATWAQVQAKADPAGKAYGRLWVQLGDNGDPDVTATQDFGWDTPDTDSGYSRNTYVVVDDRAVPAGMRGRTIRMGMKGYRSTTAGAATLVMDAVTGISLVVIFLERAE